MRIVTISRQFGSGGDEIAHRVSKILKYTYLDKDVIREVASEMGIWEDELVDLSEDTYKFKSFLDSITKNETLAHRATATVVGREMLDEERYVQIIRWTVEALARRGNVVVVGRGGQAVLRDSKDTLHVRVVAPLETRIRRVMQTEKVSRELAERIIEDRDRAASQYLRRFFKIEWEDPTLYHLILNADKVDAENAAQLIVDAANRL